MKKILICVGTRPNFIKVTSFKKLAYKYNFEIKLLHPRTKKSLIKHSLWDKFKSIKNLIYTDSLGYLDFMKLVTNSKIVITDSGGIQEETTFLQIPCITVRENTERPITIEMGNNELVQLNASLIFKRMAEKLKSAQKGKIPSIWDGHATERILEILSKS